MHILHPTYFPSIAHFVALIKADNIVFEAHDNYSKQTYRNRTCLYAANGKLTLNIPVHYSQNNRQKYRDVRIANEENWQEQHWKSIESAYKSSPFFEYYQDQLLPLFKVVKTNLFDFNIECLKTIYECLDLEFNYYLTDEYHKEYKDASDYRYLVMAKNEKVYKFNEYIQVFNVKHGFIANLSVLDLLFNEGPNTINYLEAQTI